MFVIYHPPFHSKYILSDLGEVIIIRHDSVRGWYNDAVVPSSAGSILS